VTPGPSSWRSSAQTWAGPPTAEESPLDDDAILDGLIQLNRDGRARSRAKLRSRAGAHQYLRLYRLVRQYVPPGASVLDWGAAGGHFSYFLARAGYRASGFSFHPFEFESWLDDPGYRFTRGDPSEPVKLPYADASFDAVASIGVLEHVRETGGSEPASLDEIVRVLRPGGLFFCRLASSIHALAFARHGCASSARPRRYWAMAKKIQSQARKRETLAACWKCSTAFS
jgi:SAM-dependent methyltransferase